MNSWLMPALFVGGAFVFFFLVGLIKIAARSIGASMNQRGLPFEHRLYQWLQDRATSRTMGIDVDIIRARRKIDFPDQRP